MPVLAAVYCFRGRRMQTSQEPFVKFFPKQWLFAELHRINKQTTKISSDEKLQEIN